MAMHSSKTVHVQNTPLAFCVIDDRISVLAVIASASGAHKTLTFWVKPKDLEQALKELKQGSRSKRCKTPSAPPISK